VKDLWLDYETYCDLPIKKAGGVLYAAHWSSEILIAGFAINDEPIKTWGAGDSEPWGLVDAMEDPQVQVWTWNALFEYSITRDCLLYGMGYRLPCVTLRRFRDAQALSASLALPLTLDDAARAIKLPVTKDPRGKQLIKRFSTPQGGRIRPEDDPEGFTEFREYCQRDVGVLREFVGELRERALSPFEQRVWVFTAEMNLRGIPLDMDTVRSAEKIVTAHTTQLEKECESVTGGLRSTQRDKLLKWLNVRVSPQMENLQALTLVSTLETSLLLEEARQVLKIRQSTSRSSTKKLQRMIECVGELDRVRGGLAYHVATTGRWGGRLIQPHNFPRPSYSLEDIERILGFIQDEDLEGLVLVYGDPLEAISSCLRAMICAPEGSTFLVGDYASIEARGLCWVAGQEDVLKMYRQGGDPYVDMAAHVYGIPYTSVTPKQRFLGKIIILGCGYNMGWETFIGSCATWGVTIGEQDAKDAVFGYRIRYDKVTQLWTRVGNAALHTVRTGETTEVQGLRFSMKRVGHTPFMFMRLPSGRSLAYPSPAIEKRKTSWGEWTDTVTFFGQIPGKAIWGRRHTYGGRLVENAVQGICRDLISYGMLKAEGAGFKQILSVHDEAIAEVREADTVRLNEYLVALCSYPAWAEGMPMSAEGYHARRYRKG